MPSTHSAVRPSSAPRGPRYGEVKRIILERIAAGKYSATLPAPPDKVLAAELGVSPMTVWRAMQELVLEGVLVRKPGRGKGTFVRPDARARSARATGCGNPLQRVGVLFQGDRLELQASPIFFLTFLELQSACARRGVSLEFLPLDGEATAEQILQAAEALNRQALLVLRWGRPEVLADVQDAGLPVVVAGPGLDHMPLNFVIPNDCQGAFLVTRHLLRLGHRTVGAVYPRALNRPAADRLVGCRLALAAEAQPEMPPTVDDNAHPCYVVPRGDDQNFDSLRATLVRQFKERRPPTALFCRDGFMAYAAILALREIGLRCPQDVSVACVGSFFERALEMPHMTTAVLAEGALGNAALQLCEDLLFGRQPAPAGVTLMMQLVEGATSGPPPSETRLPRRRGSPA